MDFSLSAMGFLMLSPLFLFTAVCLSVANKGNPFFLQPRPGRNNRIFRIIKFKTMNDNKGRDGRLLPDAMRLTAAGALVRKTSLDEIPQLINVLKGDMSLVGPRPLLTEYLPLYSTKQIRRHEVRPGITGWAQVNGRNALSWEQKFDYDVWYVDNLSFILDAGILWKTIFKVFRREDINAAESVTMEKFKGNGDI